jgi:hypothetical protein
MITFKIQKKMMIFCFIGFFDLETQKKIKNCSSFQSQFLGDPESLFILNYSMNVYKACVANSNGGGKEKGCGVCPGRASYLLNN